MSAAPLDIAIAAASDVGTVREHNEDSLLVGDLDEGTCVELTPSPAAGAPPGTPTSWHDPAAERGALLVVCDGMGGVVGGEVASELAAAVMWREMKGTPATRDPEVFARLLRRAARVANHDVHAMAQREPGLRGMGTTLSAAGVVDDRLVVATVGDSRAYILRAGELVQVTRDQSLQQALLAAGHDSLEAANAGGAILQALGAGEDVEPSLSIIELRRGDRVLLCSDGLHGLVGDPALALLMSPPHSVAEAASLLIAAARAAGGTDNITAIVTELGGGRLSPPAHAEDLPRFREFDPQQEGDPALTSTSHVARRLAQRIGIGLDLDEDSFLRSIPVTGQHAVMQSQNRMPRVPATELPISLDGPARSRLGELSGIAWYWYIVGLVFACAVAWSLGGR